MKRRWSQAALLTVSILCVPATLGLYEWPRETAYIKTSQYCLSCHDDSGEGLGGHATVDCQACHAVPEDKTFSQVLAMVGGSMPEHGAVLERSCQECHAQSRGKWIVLMQTEGHASHVEDPVSVRCVRCHSSSLHGDPTEEEGCGSCHESTIAGVEDDAVYDCATCHNFGETATERTAGTWGADITTDDVHGAADCRLCHDPHLADSVGGTGCTTCHRGSLSRSSDIAPEGHRECTTCHRPHGPRAELVWTCGVCHRAPRVRGRDRDPGVPPEQRELTTVVPTLAALTEPPEPPRVAHEARCATCHSPHSWEPDRDRCRECHPRETQSLADEAPDTHSCLGCHEPHSPAPPPNACAECHRRVPDDPRPGHLGCTTCHDPHESVPAVTESCSERCHVEERTELVGAPPEHARCTSCHDPHGSPPQDTSARCAECHRAESRQFPRSGRVTCAHCHRPHGFEATPEAEPVHRR